MEASPADEAIFSEHPHTNKDPSIIPPLHELESAIPPMPDCSTLPQNSTVSPHLLGTL